MTSTASPQPQIPAPNTSSATSYASAAGSAKKPSSTPLIAAGTTTGTTPAAVPAQPPVVVGSSAGASQIARTPSGPALNGRPPIAPAVPAVASSTAAPAVVHGSSNVNGSAVDHSRKPSVTISATAPGSYVPNGGPVGGPKVGGIQFGFDSPAGGHSTPQPSATAPIPIPGSNVQRVASPPQPPSPIPLPSASGGRPPAGMPGSSQMTFGSFQGDGDRPPRQPSLPQNTLAQQSAHLRKDSTQSIHSDMGGHVGPGPGRGGYQGQGGRGRPNYNAPNYNPAAMAFPQNRSYSGPQNQGRGGMPNYPPGRGAMSFNNSPRNSSPAMQPSMPHTGTPNMAPAMPMQGPGQQYYPQMPPAYVNTPASHYDQVSVFKPGKDKGNRRNGDPGPRNRRQFESSQKRGSHANEYSHRHPRLSKRSEPGMESELLLRGHHPQPTARDGFSFQPFVASRQPPLSVPVINPHELEPVTGRFESLLTQAKQNFPGYPPPPQSFDHLSRPVAMGYGGYPPMNQMYMPNQPPQSPSPAFAQAYGPGGQYPQGPPAPQPMSRNSSQISTERPASTTGQNQGPVIVSSTNQPHAPPAKGRDFVRPPKKSAAIVIKNAQGEAVDLSDLKAPVSPAPSIQQSKTPPVVASTPTPPPPPPPAAPVSQPAHTTAPAHARTESTATTKTAEQLRNEFKEQVRKTTEAPADVKAKADSSAEDATDKAVAGALVQEKADVQEPKEAAKEAAPETAPEAKQPVEEAAKADEKAAEGDAKEDEEDEMERMIREMEEEDARREKEQAEITARKKVEQAEAKKRTEADRLASAADNDRKLREQEREMERLEEEKERQRAENEAKAAQEGKAKSVSDLLAEKVSDLSLSDAKDSAPSSPGAPADKASSAAAEGSDTGSAAGAGKGAAAEKTRSKPAALNLAPLITKAVEPPQPSAALQSLKSARFLNVINASIYPPGIHSPNPALNAAVARKGKTFKYDAQFLLQFQKVFTEQPSLEFGQQVKALIGDSDASRSASSARPSGTGSGRQNSRTNAPGFPAMGSFNAPPPGKSLPPGTTSAERFAMSQGTLPRPNPINPMASFSRPGGAFPGGSQMARTPSSSNMGNMIPNSPRQGSRSTRGGGGSKRTDYTAKAEAQAAKTMPLTQGMDLKPITTSATGWKPSSIGNRVVQNPTGVLAQGGHMDPEIVQRKVKAALNKMTPENFDKISDQILVIAGQSRDETDGRTLRQVIQLTFEKATDEAHWASMYAKFCKRMLEMMSPEIRDVTIKDKAGNVVSGGALFRKYLLNRCQEEFERGWKVDLPEQKEGEGQAPEEAEAEAEGGEAKKPGEAVMMSEEYYLAMKAKRQGLGLVQFIGELYKLGMLTERIMHECVRKLLEFQGIPDEAEIESLCKLLRTIGGNLDATEKGRPMMDAYFVRIQSIIELPELPSRLKFMLMDVVDLRRAQWASKDTNKGPKTLDEVRAEAEAQAAQKAAEAARSSQRSGPGGPGRPQMGRGDARNFSYNQPAPNQVGMDDLRRLQGKTNRTTSQNVTLGPTSMFSSRSNSGRRLGPGGSLARAGEDSGASSRTGTPPTRERESVAHTNAFGLLADTGEHPASPPSTAASPSLAKVNPHSATAAAADDKKAE